MPKDANADEDCQGADDIDVSPLDFPLPFEAPLPFLSFDLLRLLLGVRGGSSHCFHSCFCCIHCWVAADGV